MSRLVAMAIGLSVAACSSLSTPSIGPSTTVQTEQPVTARAEDGEGRFQLVFELPTATWSADEPIEGLATLSLVEGETAEISGSGSGIVFEFTEIGGERRVDPIWTSDCAPYDIRADSPFVEQIEKSGAMDDDFSRAFLPGPRVLLPPGRWEIAAIASFVEGVGCPGPSFTLRAAVPVQVDE